ncbi:hypothetical protein P7K49_031235 [Saguinus oedipus]|uniref:Uncharacterized protein n=1 Tax=Saguinus oedipus TaxID=9490 RepID=A0ABQ9U4G6_SAGOE|nr:hypothetical protein P7K49_031235 [Saguinus oedipus]
MAAALPGSEPWNRVTIPKAGSLSAMMVENPSVTLRLGMFSEEAAGRAARVGRGRDFRGPGDAGGARGTRGVGLAAAGEAVSLPSSSGPGPSARFPFRPRPAPRSGRCRLSTGH